MTARNQIDWNKILEDIKIRYSELQSSERKDRFLSHFINLSEWEKQQHYNFEEGIKFPESVFVWLAVCAPECGERNFIVDGSTQECQHCGRLMYRVEGRDYLLVMTK